MQRTRLDFIFDMTFRDGHRRRPGRRPIRTAQRLLGIILAAAVATTGCASSPAREKEPPKPAKFITDLVTVEDAETVSLIFRSNQPLTYSAVKQAEPPGIYFQFPETVLDGLDSVYFPPSNPVIRSVRVQESGGQKPEAHIFLELFRDVPYTVVPEGHDLRVVFAQAGTTLPRKETPRIKTPAPGPAPAVSSQPEQIATVVKKVSVTSSADRVVIRVIADGPIKNVKTFTIADQAKIVFDIVGLRSVYRGEQRIPVESSWVRLVRHYGYPDKVRLVVETDREHLKAYTTDNVSDGLVITISQKTASALETLRLAEAQPLDSSMPEDSR